MLILQGNSAVIFHIAKGALRELPDMVTRLQAGIAHSAGLSSTEGVRKGELLRMVADLHDSLVVAGLLTSPSRDLVGYITLVSAFDERNRETTPVVDLLLGGMMSALQMTRIGSVKGEQLIEWLPAIPADFEPKAYRLSRKTTGAQAR
jgi:hypothetical protein